MKKEQLALREQALLTAALNCFATERCEDVTVARIAKLAGVAKGTVYLHFDSKDKICARLAQDFYDGLAQKYGEITGDGCAQLKAIIETSFSHYHALKHYRHIVQYCYREHFVQNLNPDTAQALKNIGIVRRQRIAQALELGATDQTLSANARTKLTGICCTIEGALNNYAAQELEQMNEMEFIDTVSRYILLNVGHNNTIKPIKDAQSHSPELIPEV